MTLSFEGFLPQALLQRLVPAESSVEPREARFDAAVLFADISGFTALTERYSKQGARGLEQLSAILNERFSMYVREVYACGGEVARFAGDALVAYFVAERPEDALQRAAACAWSLLDPDHAVSLHVGIGAGPLWTASVGGWNGRWEFLLGGRALRLAALADAQADEGTVVVAAPETVRASLELELIPQTNSQVSLHRLRAPPSRPKEELRAIRTPSEAMRSFLPPVVAAHLAARHEGWLAELRPISALFVKIEGIDEREEGALAKHQAAALALQRALDGRAAPVGKLIIDDKGLVFRVAFGVRSNAHADDPVRSVVAALAAARALRELGLTASVGLSHGSAFCGPVGSVQRQEYMILGPAMNLAARLMQTAQGEERPLCTEEIVEAAKSKIAFEPFKALRLKGFDAPVQTWFAMGASASSGAKSRAALLGRESEQAFLQERLQARRGPLLIEGEAGLGKSLLLDNLLQRARSQGLLTLLGEADAVQNQVLYWVFRPIFAQLLQPILPKLAEGVFDQEAGVRALSQHLPERLLPRLKLLDAVLPVELPETELTRNLDDASRAEATLRFLEELFWALLQGRPAVLALEDGQWLDSASWRLIEALSQRDLFLVVTARPGVELQVEMEPLRLGPLDAPALSGLVEALLGGPIDEALSSAIFERTTGNPLFAQEFALLLEAAGKLRRDSKGWSLRPGATLDAPRTVQGMITSRIDLLSPLQALTLKSASVFGRVFEERLLCAVYPGPEGAASVREALDTLRERQLVDRDGDVWSFRHAVTQEVAYGLMLSSQKKGLHRSIAEWVERENKRKLAPFYPLLARHFDGAEDEPKALLYAERAGAQALRAGAYREAVRFLKRCMRSDLKPQRLHQIRWHRQLSDAFHGLGDVEQRGVMAQRALTLSGTPAPQRTLGLAVSTAGELAKMLRPDRRSGAAGSGTKLALSADQEMALERARAFRQVAAAAFFQNRTAEVVYATVHAVKEAERAGPSGALSGAYAEMGGCFGLVGLHPVARRFERLAQQVAAESQDLASLGYAHMVNALYLVGIGDWEGTRQSVRICQEICEQLDDHVNWSNAQAVRFWLHHYTGGTGSAESAARALLERARQVGNQQQESWGLRCLAICHLRASEAEKAIGALEGALRLQSTDKDIAEQIATWGGLAWAYLKAQRAEEALEAALEGRRLIQREKRPTSHVVLEGYWGVAAALLHARSARPRSEAAPFRPLTHWSLSALRSYQRVFPIGRARYLHYRAKLEALEGRTLRAQVSRLRATQSAERMSLGYDLRLLSL